MKNILKIVLLLLSVNSFSQELSTIKQRTFCGSDTIFIDSLLIMPGSVNIFHGNEKIEDSLWIFNPQNSSVILKNNTADSVSVKYRVLPFSVKKRFKHSNSSILPESDKNVSEKSDKIFKIDEVLGSDNLKTQGSVSKGIGVGNNQDAVLTSKMDLKLSGKLSDNLNIQAVAFDENMPVQPDGNTAQIQELNNIYIKIFNPKFSLTGGDFSLSDNKSFFLNYNKQLKGLDFTYGNDSLLNYKLELATAIAKGKYRKQHIAGVEANQGPYRLLGSSGETYIVVLAGSERVYIDGKILKRGSNFDYTISYNTAEITFTPTNIITKDSRIMVEFEYSERNYSRFTLITNNSYKCGENEFFVNIYSEKDAGNQTIDRELTDPMKNILYNAGDNQLQAIYENVDSVAFSVDKILYQKLDTLINGNIYSIYRYSKDKQKAKYQVNFTFSGGGTGDYIISEQTANGRIYKFVEPVDGVKQGEYQPYSVLVSPKKKQVYDFASKLVIADKNLLHLNLAISNVDSNLFSPFDDKNNNGLAFKINFKHLAKGIDSSIANKKTLYADYQVVGRRFEGVEIYEKPEFNRDWNIVKNFTTNQHILKLGYLSIQQNHNFDVNVAGLYHSAEYFAIKPKMNFKGVGEYINCNFIVDYMHSSDYVNRTDFVKSYVDVTQKIAKFNFQTSYEQETNLWKKGKMPMLQKNSAMFHSLKFAIYNVENNKFNLKTEYVRRWDFLPDSIRLSKTSIADNISVVGKFTQKQVNGSFVVNYRKLKVSDTNLLNLDAENSLSGRFLMNYVLLNKTFDFSTNALLASGLEQIYQYIFIEVEPSKGAYTWNDYNNDNVKQIDEFEIAVFADEANYVKTIVNSNEYVKVYSKNFAQTMVFNPAHFFKDSTIAYNLLSKISNITSFDAKYKSKELNFFDFSNNKSLTNSLFINNILNLQLNSKLNLAYEWKKNKSKSVILVGTDIVTLEKNKLFFRYKLLNDFKFTNELSVGYSGLVSDYSKERNYLIISKLCVFRFAFVPDDFQVELSYSYADKRNNFADEVLFINDFGVVVESVITLKNVMHVSFNYVHNNFFGNSAGSVGYVMLNGLKQDKNYVWGVNIKRFLGKIMQITLNYSGRYSSSGRVLHTGSVSLTAAL